MRKMASVPIPFRFLGGVKEKGRPRGKGTAGTVGEVGEAPCF